MSYTMCVAVYICDELFKVYEHVANIEHKGSFVRIYLSDGDVKTFSADEDFTLKLRFNELDDYPF